MDGTSPMGQEVRDTHPAWVDSAIHLWVLGVRRGDEPDFLEYLNPEERRRAERFRSETAYHEYVRARGRLRVLLARYLGRKPWEIDLIANAHGKPRLAGTEENQGLVFNVSHSGECVLLAFARDTVLGVDIESLRDRHDLRGLAGMCLAPPEHARWEAVAGEWQLTEFLRFWVSKEAFVKAVGRGIGLGLKRVVVNAAYDGFEEIPGEYGSAADWHLREWPLGVCRAALVFKGGEREILMMDSPSP